MSVVYRGPSRLDGAPIVGIVTGLGGRSRNRKTGAMAQLWILPSAQDPVAAVRSGADRSVCGDCMHRPVVGGACYVTVGKAPLSVYRALQRGSYPEGLARACERLAESGLAIRLGAWGDPASLPVSVIDALAGAATGWTGYTHQWRHHPTLMRWLMASVDSEPEAEQAQALGWRTFRVRSGDEPLTGGEIVCPASDEGGHRTTCERCRLCSGARSGDRRRNIAIVAHGAKAKRFRALAVV